MITRMKKLQCLVYHREYDEFLEQLRSLGVVHVEAENIDEAENVELKERLEGVRRIERIADQLRNITVSDDVAKTMAGESSTFHATNGNARRGREVAERVESINSRIAELNTVVKRAYEQIEALKPWGNFDPDCTSLLTEANRRVRFYTVSNKTKDDKWFTEHDAFVISNDKTNTYFVSIDVDGEEPCYPTAVETTLPRTTLRNADNTLRNAQAELPKLTTELQVLASQNLSDVEAAEHDERANLTFRHVQLGTERAADDTLMVLTGWLPANNEKAVNEALSSSKAWFQISMPTPNDRVPTLMRNGRITRLYEVLTNMYGTPDHDEFDATPMIAIFFSIFFGFCVGDAGYGLVLLFFGFPICKFLKNGLQLNINPVLVTTLGFASTLMGLLLGTAFGVSLADVYVPCGTPWYNPLSWIQALQPYMITGQLPGTNYDMQMVLALGIGVLHICIAMFMKALGNHIKYGFRVALVDWSWWLLVVAGVVIGLLTALTTLPQDVLKYTLMAIGLVCAVGIFILNDPNRKVLPNIGAGLWATYNMATGLLGDVLSYIRLYALGLAGGMLGGVFNQLAIQVAGGSEQFGWIFMLLIMVLGHTLNIAMSCLSAFVHPLRLTFVEYFKNSGYNGKGVAYQPLTK